MTTKELSLFLNSEDLSEKYLRDQYILKTFTACPKCNSIHFVKIRRQRHKCYYCKHEWNIRKGSILESSHMQLSTFIGCMKFFSDEMPAYRCSIELEVNRAVINDLYHLFQNKLLQPIKKLCSDRNELIVYIGVNNNCISIGLDDPYTQTSMNSRLILQRSKDDDNCYYYLVRYKNLRVKPLLKSINNIDELDNFFRFIQERLLTFRGRDSKSLVWKIQELVFRYNQRSKNFYDLLITKIKSNTIGEKMSP